MSLDDYCYAHDCHDCHDRDIWRAALAARACAIVAAAEAFVAALDVDGEEPRELRELIAAVRGESGGASGG